MAEWIWIHLIQRKPGLWYELPCGLHAEVDVLRGAAIQLIVGATRVGAHNVHALCDPRPEGWGPKASGPKLDGDVGKYRQRGMPSAFFCPSSTDDIGRGRIGPVDPVPPGDDPRLGSSVSALPAITHGAGRCLPLARRDSCGARLCFAASSAAARGGTARSLYLPAHAAPLRSPARDCSMRQTVCVATVTPRRGTFCSGNHW